MTTTTIKTDALLSALNKLNEALARVAVLELKLELTIKQLQKEKKL